MNLPPVLVPRLDLGVREVETGSELHAVLDREVLLSLEAPFQRVELVVRERRAGLAWLLGLARAVAVSTRRDLVVFTWRFTREQNERANGQYLQ